MTDGTPDSELVSAYLDGEATAAEMEHVETDPTLSARVEQLRALRERLAADPPTGLVDDHVSAALAVFDRAEDTAADTAPEAVTDLAVRRRRPLHERIPLGAAAAAVVVLALFGALTQLDLGGDDEMATAGDDTASEEAGFDDAGETDDGDSGDGTDDAAVEAPLAENDSTLGDGAPATGAAGYVLAFSDTDALADHLVQRFDDRARSQPQRNGADESTTVPADREVDPCDATAVTGVDPATVMALVPAVIAGEPVTALVVDDAGRRLVVVDDSTCSVIDDRPL